MRRGVAERVNRLAAWLILLFLVAPALVAIPVSLTPKAFLSMPQGEYSLRHFIHLFTSPAWLSSFWQSAVIATCATILATLVGTLAAIGLWCISSRASELVRAFLLLPLIIPPIISAMASKTAAPRDGISIGSRRCSAPRFMRSLRKGVPSGRAGQALSDSSGRRSVRAVTSKSICRAVL